jgi:hypothetical protein
MIGEVSSIPCSLVSRLQRHASVISDALFDLQRLASAVCIVGPFAPPRKVSPFGANQTERFIIFLDALKHIHFENNFRGLLVLFAASGGVQDNKDP